MGVSTYVVWSSSPYTSCHRGSRQLRLHGCKGPRFDSQHLHWRHFFRHQAHMWCTDVRAGKTLVHVIKINLKKQEPSHQGLIPYCSMPLYRISIKNFKVSSASNCSQWCVCEGSPWHLALRPLALCWSGSFSEASAHSMTDGSRDKAWGSFHCNIIASYPGLAFTPWTPAVLYLSKE